MHILLVEPSEAIAETWLLGLRAVYNRLSISTDENFHHCHSLSELMGRLEQGSRPDLVLIGDGVLRESVPLNAATEAIQRFCPNADVKLLQGCPESPDDGSVDPFSSLVSARSLVPTTRTSIQQMVLESHRRSKEAIGGIEERLFPLIEKTAYLANELSELKACFSKTEQRVYADSRSSLDASVLAQREIAELMRRFDMTSQLVAGLEEDISKLVVAQRRIDALLMTVSTLTGSWRGLVGFVAGISAIVLVIERIIASIAG